MPNLTQSQYQYRIACKDSGEGDVRLASSIVIDLISLGFTNGHVKTSDVRI